MMHGVLDHDKRLIDRVASLPGVRRMRGGFEPGVCVAVDECKAWVLDVKCTVLVYVFDLCWDVDIKSLAADNTAVGDVDQA